MAYKPTYDEFERQAKELGLLEEFSPYDLAIAREDPSYGLTILSAKKGYKGAATDEQRKYFNGVAEQARKSAGNFAGGTDGSLYIALPEEHRAGDDALGAIRDYSQNSGLTQKTHQQLDRLGSYGDFRYEREPDYNRILDSVIDREEFSYDPASDPSYSAYRKAYTREGRRASEDTMGQYAAMTGGRPSTAAVTAAQQAGNYYAAKLSDKLPELYQQAYQRYLNEYTQKLNGLNAITADRNMRYGEFTDRYNRERDYLGQLQGQDDREYGRLTDYYGAVRDLEESNYAKEREADATRYSREQDALDRQLQREQIDYNREQDADKTAWERYLDEWEMRNTDKKNAMSEAEWRAQRGQYDQMAELLGMSVDEIRAIYEPEATTAAYTGGLSGSGGSNGSESEEASPYTKDDITWARKILSDDKVDKNSEAYYMAWQIMKSIGWDTTGFLPTEEPEQNDPYHGYSEEEYKWARGVIDDASKGKYDTASPGYAYAREIMSANGMKFPEGYGDGVDNSGRTHSDGSLKSKGFDEVMSEVYQMLNTARGGQTAKIDNIKFKLRNAVEQGRIHEYEIDIILDSLGL